LVGDAQLEFTKRARDILIITKAIMDYSYVCEAQVSGMINITWEYYSSGIIEFKGHVKDYTNSLKFSPLPAHIEDDFEQMDLAIPNINGDDSDKGSVSEQDTPPADPNDEGDEVE